ncbi:diaminopropionate ammonia-lyase [Acinetobacter ihumii]|uniref:diaminopropionate ammonia-lyase n=1 Tax=Acinetobacter ihumii TaxID=2483802 RepID=UPI001030E3D4|nr:diaminopropionate ammonia-lyase [Acinetobacter ihumii]
MSNILQNMTIHYFSNPQFRPGLAYGVDQRNILGGQRFIDAKQTIEQWQGYSPSPLVELPHLARELGIKNILYKDESRRFGLSSFKALGGAYAVFRLLLRKIQYDYPQDDVSLQDLLSGKYREVTEKITVTCATDGNHGRSVAWGARTFGCKCVIYIHSTVSQGRADAIAKYGADVIRTQGNYDDSVRQADHDAKQLGRFVVSDTSYEGYMDVPKDVMQGYAVMADEVLQKIPSQQKISHVFLQGGVGGLAAAVTAQLWEQLGDQKPIFIVVEPDQAACLFESAKAGQPVAVEGELNTIMAGLACGEVSLLAWSILKDAVSHFLTIDDQSAVEVMKILATGQYGDQNIVAGESAVAGLAGCIGAATHPDLKKALQLDEKSCVLVIGSEGATDPELYQQIIGKTAEQIWSAA